MHAQFQRLSSSSICPIQNRTLCPRSHGARHFRLPPSCTAAPTPYLTWHRLRQKRGYALHMVQGAPEAVLARCTRALAADGTEVPLTPAMREDVTKRVR